MSKAGLDSQDEDRLYGMNMDMALMDLDVWPEIFPFWLAVLRWVFWSVCTERSKAGLSILKPSS